MNYLEINYHIHNHGNKDYGKLEPSLTHSIVKNVF